MFFHRSQPIATPQGSKRRNQLGVGLIEVLVSVVLLSFGFLVVAQMQLQAISTSQSAFRMSQASYMVTEMIDKMSRNNAGVINGDYDNITTSGTATAPICAATGCTPSQSAQLDTFEWSAHVHNVRNSSNYIPLIPPGPNGALPTGSVTVNVDGVFIVTVNWVERLGATIEPRNLTVEFIP